VFNTLRGEQLKGILRIFSRSPYKSITQKKQALLEQKNSAEMAHNLKAY
jgi:hypothetical protein